MKLEVLVDDRVFIPLAMNVELKQSIKVTAEAKVMPQRRKGPSVSASILSENSTPVATPTRVKPAPKPRRPISKNISRQRKIRESREKTKRSQATPEDKELRNMLLDLFKKDV
jgi:hypothetical protein